MKKEQIDQSFPIESKREFEVRNNKKYEVKTIINSVIYSHKVENQLLSLYYLVS